MRSGNCLVILVAWLATAALTPFSTWAQTASDADADQPELEQPSGVPPLMQDSEGGVWVPAEGELPQDRAPSGGGLPNLAIESIQIVGAGGDPIEPVAGENFYVRVNFSYANPVCTEYTIARTVNGWDHEAPNINWGCGYSGETFWWHSWGVWLMHHGGEFSVTVTLDANNTIAESNEEDNTATLNFTALGKITSEWARVGAEAGTELLGDGTDVIVGTMDDAFDFNHPWVSGVDSKGRPRLIAANQNALGEDGSPLNANHATAVMGIVLADGLNAGDITGLAPDARYVTAEFINRADIPELPVLHVLDAAGFLVDHDVEVINMSWSWWFGSSDDSQSGEGSVTNLMTDYLAYGRNIVCVPAVNQLPGYDMPTAPGAARNALTVGGLKDNLIEAWEVQDHGPTLDGRGKPDLLGNDSANAVAPYWAWRLGFPAAEGFIGTSFAAPFVTGAVAQVLDYGKHNNGNTDHRVVKAVIMNSAVKVLDDDGSPWSHTETQPLDDQQGTGLLDMLRTYETYSAGEQVPHAADVPGYDLGVVTSTVNGNPTSGRVVYRMGTLQDTATRLDATLVWDRHTFWNDANSSGSIDEGDFFHTRADTGDAQDNLDLVLLRDGVEVSASRSEVDNVEHISAIDLLPGTYELHVERLPVADSGEDETFALAWFADGEWVSSCPCPADFSGDGNVGPLDLASLLGNWGPILPDADPAVLCLDGNGDGIMGPFDLAALLGSWGPCP